jgi:hypothetical protein
MTRRRRRSRNRLAASALWLGAIGHAAALGSLAVIGPPPAVRIDALWVNDQRLSVQLGLAGLALAGVASLLLLVMRRHRLPLAVLWMIAAGAAVVFFSDRIPLIARVLLRHAS